VSRRTTWTAAGLWSMTAALIVAAIAFLVRFPVPGGDVLDFAIILLVMTSFPTVGAVIAARRPRNPIGWIFSAMGSAFVLAVLLGNYAEYGLRIDPGSLPGAVQAAWVSNFIWPVFLAPIGFVLLLFPDGHAPRRRWRVVGWALGASLLGLFVALAFDPGPLSNAGYEFVSNPYGIEPLEGVLQVLGPLSAIVLVTGVLASVVSLIVRFVRSGGDERRQLKWLAYASGLVGVTAVISLSIEGTNPDDSPIVRVLQLSLLMAISGVPVATGIAILRHRLYDIDRLISRTIVYVLVTGSLVAVYAGTVFITGTVAVGSSDNLTVAVATLVAAAVFRPLLVGVRDFVDRRFYRHKYDAQKTIDDFGSRLREETDLDELTDDLVGVVRTTMQPSHVSVWLRESRAGP
jgi:hypothetical protein